MTRPAARAAAPSIAPDMPSAAPSTRRVSPARPWPGWLGAALLYLGVAVALFARTWASPRGQWMGSVNDPQQHIWFLAWVPWALAHGHTPLLTDHVLYPAGANLMWNPLMASAGLLLWPVTALAGPVAAYDVLATLGVAASALAARAAILRVVPHRAGALVGGLFYGFSPYAMAEAHGHVNLLVTPFPPLTLLLLHDALVTRRMSPRRTGLLLGLCAVAQLLLFEEVLATTALASIVAAAVLAALHRERIRATAARLTRVIGWALLVAVPLAAYPLAVQFLGPERVTGAIFPSGVYSNDLAGVVLPTDTQALAPSGLVSLSSRFTGDPQEWVAYLGIPLLVCLAITVVRRADTVVRWAAITALLLIVLSLGPSLHVLGHDTGVPLPYTVVDHVPLLQDMLPARLMVDVDLCVAVLIAVALARTAHLTVPRRRLALVAAGLCAASLVPKSFEASHVDVPAFFTGGDVRRIPEGSVVLVVPQANLVIPDAMLWQAESGLWFRMLGGYTEGHLEPATDATQVSRRMADLVQGLRVPPLDGPLRARLLADLQQRDVGSVVVGPTPHRAVIVADITALLGRPPVEDAGVELWAGLPAPR